MAACAPVAGNHHHMRCSSPVARLGTSVHRMPSKAQSACALLIHATRGLAAYLGNLYHMVVNLLIISHREGRFNLMTPLTRFSQAVLVLLITSPLVVFVLLTLNPAWNPAPSLPVFHFYIVTFTSLIALVVASFVLIGIGTTGDVQGTFVSMAFVAIAGFFMTHGALTPGIAVQGEYAGIAVGWAGRLSLLAGGLLLGLALADLPPQMQRWVTVNRRVLWLILGFAFAVHLWISFDFPDWLEAAIRNPILSGILALTISGIFMWAAFRAWRMFRRNGRTLPLALTIGLPYLALAQISQYAAPVWALSWWLYHILMLLAFSLAMIALVLEYEQILDFKLTRYFVSLSIILAALLAIGLGEIAVRVTGIEAARWPLVGLSLVSFMVFFLIVFLVVRHGAQILDQRALSLRLEKQWRTDFTNLLVHDLKSPLTAIRGSLNLITLTAKDDLQADQKRYVQRAEQASKDLLGMIDNLLDVERLEGGAIPFNPAFFDLAVLLTECVNAVRDPATLNQVTLNASIPENLPLVEADQGLIRRVVQNLLANALRFVPTGGYLYLRASAADNQVTVSVTDNGPGVPVSDRLRIFDKFQQGQGAERGGAGLGLTFCKLAVESHAGRIWVEDNPSGSAGSAFIFTIPLARGA